MQGGCRYVENRLTQAAPGVTVREEGRIEDVVCAGHGDAPDGAILCSLSQDAVHGRKPDARFLFL